jgi:hypothetical protein
VEKYAHVAPEGLLVAASRLDSVFGAGRTDPSPVQINGELSGKTV